MRSQTLALLSGAVLLAGCGSSSSASSSSATSSATSSVTSSTASASTKSAAQLGFEGVGIEAGADLASPGTTQTGTVSGIQCGSAEQLAYHVHAHLAVYVNGASRALPGGIGIPGSVVQQSAQGPEAAGGQCIYWLHTHAPDGVVHIESPTQRIYTLGNFFDEWHQPLGPSGVAGSSGKVTAFVNGKRWTKNPRLIPLDPHAVIQLDVGTPAVPFHPMSWSGLQL
jgi:hypothetical protein